MLQYILAEDEIASWESRAGAQIGLLEANIRCPEGRPVGRDNRWDDVEAGIVAPRKIDIAREAPVAASKIDHGANVVSVHQCLDISHVKDGAAEIGATAGSAAPDSTRIDEI